MNFEPVRHHLEEWAWYKAYNDPDYRKRKSERDEKIKALKDEDRKDFEEVKNKYLKTKKK